MLMTYDAFMREAGIGVYEGAQDFVELMILLEHEWEIVCSLKLDAY